MAAWLLALCAAQSEGDVRLFGGAHELEGRVEIYHDGRWGAVCDDNFDDFEAKVVCRQLRVHPAGARIIDNAAFSPSEVGFWLDDVFCHSTEQRLDECQHMPWGMNDCEQPNEEVAVTCRDQPPPPFPRPPEPSPPPPLWPRGVCLAHSCGTINGTTCADVVDHLTCEHLMEFGCDCWGCCMMEPKPPPSPPTLPPPYEAEFSPPLPPFAPFEADCFWTAVDISMWVVNFLLPTTLIFKGMLDLRKSKSGGGAKDMWDMRGKPCSVLFVVALAGAWQAVILVPDQMLRPKSPWLLISPDAFKVKMIRWSQQRPCVAKALVVGWLISMPAIALYGAGILLVWEHSVGCSTPAYEETARVVQVVAIALSWPFTLWFPFLLVSLAFSFAVKFAGMLVLFGVGIVLCPYEAHRKRQEQQKKELQKKEVQRAFDDEKEKVAAEERRGICTFTFLKASFIRNLPAETKKLPRMQEIGENRKSIHNQSKAKEDILVRKEIAWDAAFRGEYRDKYCVVSHAWETPRNPDSVGAQLKATKAYLHEHPEVEWLWYDFYCLPQRPTKEKGDDRSEVDKLWFGWQLANANLLYLGCRVLVLLDLSYQSRFWTQFELWLSLQEATPDGLTPAPEQRQRADPWPIHSATDALARSLLEMWRTKSPKDAYAVLKQPDVRVTNQSDKDTHLPKILKLNEKTQKAFREPTRKPDAPPADTPPAEPLAVDSVSVNVAGLEEPSSIETGSQERRSSTGAGTARASEAMRMASFDDDDDLAIVVRADEDVTA